AGRLSARRLPSRRWRRGSVDASAGESRLNVDSCAHDREGGGDAEIPTAAASADFVVPGGCRRGQRDGGGESSARVGGRGYRPDAGELAQPVECLRNERRLARHRATWLTVGQHIAADGHLSAYRDRRRGHVQRGCAGWTAPDEHRSTQERDNHDDLDEAKHDQTSLPVGMICCWPLARARGSGASKASVKTKFSVVNAPKWWRFVTLAFRIATDHALRACARQPARPKSSSSRTMSSSPKY